MAPFARYWVAPIRRYSLAPFGRYYLAPFGQFHPPAKGKSFIRLANYNPFRDFKGWNITGIKNPPFCNRCKYQLDQVTTYNDQPVYVVTFTQTQEKDIDVFRQYTVYINVTDLAIVKFDFEFGGPFGYGFLKYDEDSTASSLVSMKRSMRFKDHGSIYFLDYYSMYLKFQYQTPDADEPFFSVHKFDLMVNKIIAENPEKIHPSQRMDYRKTLETQVTKYDPEFWGTFNFIKQTPMDQKIISDLEKKLSLEEQFEKAEN